jgi:hypothetical protein
MPVDNPALGQVIGADFNRHLISQDHSDAIPPQLARVVSLDLGIQLRLHQEGTAWIHFLHHPFDRNQVISGQSVLQVGGQANMLERPQPVRCTR